MILKNKNPNKLLCKLSTVLFYCLLVMSNENQQWTIGLVDGEIVPLYEEMVHPTKSDIY